MSNHTINVNQLTPDSLILIRGVVGYSHITSRIEGRALQEDNMRRRSQGRIEKQKPYVTITVNKAQVLCQNQNQMTLEEQYAMERMYTSQKYPERGYSFSADSSSPVALPYVAVARPNNPTEVDQVVPEGELANGLDVTLVLRVFKPKSGTNMGVTLDGVIVNEPVRYYSNSMAGRGLEQMGITFHPVDPNTAPAADATPQAQPSYQEPDENPFASNPAPQPQPAVAAAAAASAQTASPMTPGAPMGTNPYGGANDGIRYDPASNRGY